MPEISLLLIEDARLLRDAGILDVGGGTSTLAGHLLAAGYRDVTVVDISHAALRRAQAELGSRGHGIKWIEADIRYREFSRRFDLWHDRAVFHFMVVAADRDRYLAAMRRSLGPGGNVILSTFGPDGPNHCSGLPVARYGANELSQIVGAEFELVSSQLEQHRTPGGRDQQFVYVHLRRKPARQVGRWS